MHWKAGTRVSPIWLIEGYQEVIPDKSNLVFLGPVNIASLESDLPLGELKSLKGIWASLGLFNLILVLENNRSMKSNLKKIEAWAETNGTQFEIWSLEGKQIQSSRNASYPEADVSENLTNLSSLIRNAKSQELGAGLQEFVALAASTLTRSAKSESISLMEVSFAIENASKIVWDYYDGRVPLLRAKTDLSLINAALSRFSSQTFSGTGPIFGTECHYWIHSLLGTGIANLALVNLVQFINDVVGHAKIPNRISGLFEKTDNIPSYAEIEAGGELLGFDILEDIEIEDPLGKVPPLICYFSGRDGYGGCLHTISAPLASISSCNSYKSSLLTITHEISHVIIRGVLGEMFPEANRAQILIKGVEKMSPLVEYDNWGEVAIHCIIEAIVSLEDTENSKSSSGAESGISDDQLADWNNIDALYARHKAELQEILVHAFDYAYFYKKGAEFYIENIWLSWSEILGISDRIPEYIMRSVCALSIEHEDIDIEKKATLSLNELEKCLKEIQAKKPSKSADYIAEALTQIEAIRSSGWDEFVRQLNDRNPLIRFVQIFLKSEKLENQLYADARLPRTKSGTNPKQLTLPLLKVENPLRFLSDIVNGETSETESAWVLQILANNIDLEA